MNNPSKPDLARRLRTRTAVIALSACLAGCVFLPRTTIVYDEECDISARHMVLEMEQIGAFVGCHGDGCAAVLAAAGVVAAATAVVSGSIVIAGNIVYWFEKQGRCLRRDVDELPADPPPALPPKGQPKPITPA